VSVPRPRPALAAVALTVTALGLSGCTSGSGGSGGSGGSEDTSSSGSGSASSAASPSPTSTVTVPAGQQLTDQGSRLPFGRTATVVYEPAVGHGTVLQLTVRTVRRGRLSDFGGFILDDAYKRKAAYYYATVSVKNVGEGDVGGAAVPLYGVNGSDTLLPPVAFTTRFARCPSQKLPARFAKGATLSTCLVYLSPHHGKLASVTFRPTQEFNPITWTGTVAGPAPATSSTSSTKPKR
jgi:hypothetical protein